MSLFRSTVTALSFSLLSTASFADITEGVALLESGDVTGAATAFAAAYEAGDGEGAFYLGRLFELGLGTETNETRAANLYAAAAELGSSRALRQMPKGVPFGSRPRSHSDVLAMKQERVLTLVLRSSLFCHLGLFCALVDPPQVVA